MTKIATKKVSIDISFLLCYNMTARKERCKLDKEMKGIIDVEKTASGTSSVMDFCETISEPIRKLRETQEIISSSSYDATILERSIALNQMACLYLKTITGSDKPEAEEVKLQAGVCFKRYLFDCLIDYLMDTSDDYNIKAEQTNATLKRMEELCNQAETIGFNAEDEKTPENEAGLSCRTALKNIHELAGIMLSISGPNANDFIRETLPQGMFISSMESMVQSLASGNKEDQYLAINQCEALKNYAESVLIVSKTEAKQQESTGKAK